MDETFIMTSLTAHRFLLASMLVASKGLTNTLLVALMLG